MASTFFTSDTHWGHFNIIRFCGRPFATIQEMDQALIRNWNSIVKTGDTVYHLGDVAKIKDTKALRGLVQKLNGHIHLVYGNHDKFVRQVHQDKFGFSTIQPYLEINVGEQRITLLHYAMRTWHHSFRGSLQLYGHSHSKLKDDPFLLSMDVGVDAVAERLSPGNRQPQDYRPMSFEEVKDWMVKTKHPRPLKDDEEEEEENA